jgi:hypothetical protein
MTSPARFASRLTPLVVALGIAAIAGSCGGSPTSPTSPVAVAADAAGGEGGSVTSSAVARLTVCHKGREIVVSTSALGGHLGHGDRLGSCAATCPCFTSAGIDQMAGQCDANLYVDCSEKYSVAMFCWGTWGGANLGAFQAILGTDTCGTVLKDSTGAFVESSQAVSAAEYEACKQAIFGSSSYGPSCPR